MIPNLKCIYLLFSMLFIAFLFSSYSADPPNGYTGAPGEGTCINCHEAGNVQGLDGSISISGLPATVSPNTTYTLTVSLVNPNGLSLQGGFQMVAVDANGNGVLGLSNPSQFGDIFYNSFNNKEYFEHRPSQPFDANNTVTWSVDWTAPAGPENETITFYAAGNISDINTWNNSGNDLIVFDQASATLSGGVNTNFPDLTVSNLTNWTSTAMPGDVIFFNFDINNIGNTTAFDDYTITSYLSTDPFFSGDDINVGIVPTGNTMVGTLTGVTGGITVPNSISGTYYLIIVIDSDAEINELNENNNVLVSAFATTIQSNAPLVVSTNAVDANCVGQNTGSATANPSGGTPPYSYMWSNGGTGQTISGLAAGNYMVTIQDASMTTQVTSALINNASELSGTISSLTNVSCFGWNDGLASASVLSGSSPPFSYAWSNGTTNGTGFASGFVAGSHSVTITDNLNCQYVESFTITEPNILSVITTNLTASNCAGVATGAVTVTGSGGAGSYSYDWSNNMSGSSLNNLGAGTYTVTVTDQNQCTIAEVITINTSSNLTANISNTSNVSCFGGSDGLASAIAMNGVGPYNYIWSNGSTGQTATGFSAGGHILTVTDANNCEFITNFTIIEPNILEVTTTALIESDCAGNATGSVTVVGSGGTGSYTYLWSNNATSNSLNNLAAGNYTVTVTDQNQCNAIEVITINTTSNLTVNLSNITNVSCFEGSDGEASATAMNGVAPYTYNWSNGDTGQNATGLSAGSHELTVTDNNNCDYFLVFNIIEETEAIEVSIENVVGVDCFGESSGMCSITASGGTGNYTYNWSNGFTSNSIDNVPAGNYIVSVTDSNQCSSTPTTITISQPSALPEINIVDQQDIDCFGIDNGSVTVSSTGGTGSFSYVWSNGMTGATVNNLSAGSYVVTASDANNCEAFQEIIIQSTTAIEIAYEQQDVECFGEDTGSIVVGVLGGAGNYIYTWSNGATVPNIENLMAGTYFLTVEDGNNCFKYISFTIAAPTSALVLSLVNVTNIDCLGNDSGSVTVTTTGGNSSYTYAWSNGDTGDSVTGLVAGNYVVTVSDASNCTDELSVEITQTDGAPSLIVDNQINIDCTGNSNGMAVVSASGDDGSYTYVWSDGTMGNEINNVVANTYFVTVTNQEMCTASSSVIITEPEMLTLAFENINPTDCAANSIGSASAAISGGVEPYQVDGDLENLSSGSYMITVTDANSCSVVNEVTIDIMDEIVPVVIVQDITVELGANGLAEIQAPMLDNGSMDNCDDALTFEIDINEFDCSHIGTNEVLFTATDEANNTNQALVIVTVVDNIAPEVVCNMVGQIDCDHSVDYSLPTVMDNCEALTFELVSGLAPGEVFPVGETEILYQATMANGEVLECGFNLNVPEFLGVEFEFGQSCSGQDGMITAIPTNGVAPFEYLWSTGSTESMIADLTPDTYQVTITDANDCTVESSITLIVPTEIVFTLDEVIDASEAGGEDGSLDVTVAGGTPPYTYNWLLDGEVVATTEDLTNVNAGNYSLVVVDSNGCSFQTQFTIGLMVGVNDISLGNAISLYPNPNNGVFNVAIDFDQEYDVKIELYCLRGESLRISQEMKIDQVNYPMDTQGIGAGIYFLKFIVEGQVFVKKIIVQK